MASIPTRGNEIFNIFNSTQHTKPPEFGEKWGTKLIIKIYLMGTEYLNTKFPGSLRLPCYVHPEQCKVKKIFDFQIMENGKNIKKKPLLDVRKSPFHRFDTDNNGRKETQ